MTSSSRDALPVPDEAVQRLRSMVIDYYPDFITADDVREIAGPLLAAEVIRLRDELAEHFERTGQGHKVDIYRHFTARADELDSQNMEAQQ